MSLRCLCSEDALLLVAIWSCLTQVLYVEISWFWRRFCTRNSERLEASWCLQMLCLTKQWSNRTTYLGLKQRWSYIVLFLSKLFFTLFIWQSLAMHDKVIWWMCWSKVKLLSRIIPRSLTLQTGVITFPKKGIAFSLGSLGSSCCVPTIRNLVFLGLINSWFLQNQAATHLKSSSRTHSADLVSLIEKDKKILESSTQDSRLHTCGANGRSLR